MRLVLDNGRTGQLLSHDSDRLSSIMYQARLAGSTWSAPPPPPQKTVPPEGGEQM